MGSVCYRKTTFNNPNFKQKKYTIHPELLDKSGNITEEELLTVRFSNDNDSSLEGKVQQKISQIQIRGKIIGIKN